MGQGVTHRMPGNYVITPRQAAAPLLFLVMSATTPQQVYVQQATPQQSVMSKRMYTLLIQSAWAP